MSFRGFAGTFNRWMLSFMTNQALASVHAGASTG
jgi:hypothetical protein